MKKSGILLLSLLPLLVSCATGKSVPPKQVPCPVPPNLAVERLERNWLGEMESFLQGTLPTQQGSKSPSKPVSNNTKP
jgi:hypothetical protein